MNNQLKKKPDLDFWKLWNLSFGFFGVQIAYALQSANISRIFATLGADPHDLSYFWILPPLMGILVQPIVGTLSDKTWTRFGRRIPYLFVGATVAVLVMCLLPNAGSLGMTAGMAMIFGLTALMFLDTSINMAMQPFKMLVGDMVNEKQKALAYSIQSFLCNAGSVVGFIFPFFFTFIGISNIAAAGVVPDSVIWSFYVGAAILILCVIYTTLKVKEWNPKEYAEYNQLEKPLDKEKTNVFALLRNAPKTFWTTFGHQHAPISRGRQLGGHTFRHSSHWQRAMGSGVTQHPQPQNGLCPFAIAGRHRLFDGSLHHRQVPHVRSFHSHWLRLGRHIGHALHLRNQRLGRERTHGRIPRSV